MLSRSTRYNVSFLREARLSSPHPFCFPARPFLSAHSTTFFSRLPSPGDSRIAQFCLPKTPIFHLVGATHLLAATRVTSNVVSSPFPRPRSFFLSFARCSREAKGPQGDVCIRKRSLRLFEGVQISNTKEREWRNERCLYKGEGRIDKLTPNPPPPPPPPHHTKQTHPHKPPTNPTHTTQLPPPTPHPPTTHTLKTPNCSGTVSSPR